MPADHEAPRRQTDGEAVAVNLDIGPVETPAGVGWVDPAQPAPPNR